MNRTLILSGVKPYSINNAYYKKTFTMTAECRVWRKTVIKALKSKENQQVMDEIRETFFSAIHGLVVKIRFGIPYSTYWTQKGDINSKSMDLSNVEKLLIDIICDERFYERGEIRNCNVNDKYILNLISEKTPSLLSTIVVELYIYERPTLSAFKLLHNLE